MKPSRKTLPEANAFPGKGEIEAYSLLLRFVFIVRRAQKARFFFFRQKILFNRLKNVFKKINRLNFAHFVKKAKQD